MSEPAPTFDLQSHSRHSDGELRPAEVVAAAAQAGVQLLALSDHDTVDGVREAVEAATAIGMRVVTCVEISALDPSGRDLHILGYLLDDRDPTLRERLAIYRADRERRTAAMLGALRELGFEVDEAPLRARASKGKSIGRPHIAEAVVNHPANAVRLSEAGIGEPSAFLETYLIDGRPAFRPREFPTVAEAIATIHDAGGLAVWAHPFFDFTDPSKVRDAVERFKRDGLDGIECFYLTHSAEQTRLLEEQCAERELLSTGSSDFHGPHHQRMSRFRAFSTYGLEPDLGPIGA
jgi:predicted metal-dependent phosphoesterase TrpH